MQDGHAVAFGGGERPLRRLPVLLRNLSKPSKSAQPGALGGLQALDVQYMHNGKATSTFRSIALDGRNRVQTDEDNDVAGISLPDSRIIARRCGQYALAPFRLGARA